MFDEPDTEELTDEKGQGDEPETEVDDLDLAEGEDGQEVDDLGEGDEQAPEDGGDAALAVKPEKALSRGERRIADLTRRTKESERIAREANERAERAERAATQRQAKETEAEEQARLDLMPADERQAYLRDRDRREFGHAMQSMEMRYADRSDRADFRALCESQTPKGKAFASVRDEVEERVKANQSKGILVEREVIAKYLIGERAIERAGKAAPKQRQQAQERTRRQSVAAPASGKSDTRGGDRRTGKTAAERLADVII